MNVAPDTPLLQCPECASKEVSAEFKVWRRQAYMTIPEGRKVRVWIREAPDAFLIAGVARCCECGASDFITHFEPPEVPAP